MKKSLLLAFITFISVIIAVAQPQKMTYQTVVRNANNELITNQQVGLQITIYEDMPNGPMVYRETQTTTTNANGLASIVIGTGAHPYTADLQYVNWGAHDHWLQIDIDPTGGITYTITGTQQFMTVPYAFYAGSTRYADTALFVKNAQNMNSDTAKYAIHSDTANYAFNAGNANYANSAAAANYADSARIADYSNAAGFANSSNYADSARIANYANSAATANSANTANYADSTRISDYANSAGTANSANYADSSRISNFANYADTADFNKLLNRPNGTNTGDMLYWRSTDNTWQVAPVGSDGQVLTLDQYSTPYWNTVPGLATYNSATVVTHQVSSYTGYDANVSGNISNDGGTPFVVGGFCWSQNANPTVNDAYSLVGIGTTSFSYKISGLNLGTTYHVRAFANNSTGIAYGNDESFTTWDYPAVTTYPTVSTISATTSYCGGTVTSDGGNYVNQRGVCWNTWGSPDIDNNEGMTFDGSGTGAFTSYMTGLQEGTTYYVCAYATNDIGTVYGSTITFTTLSRPSVNTNNVTDIDTMSAVSGGNVYADGGDPVTDHGIVWGTYSWIDLYNNSGSTSHGAGTVPFNFTDTMKNLTPGQYYYVRAYATNSIGTGYGSSEQFRVNPVKPTVTTNNVYDVYSYQATSGGYVSSDGGESVYQRGLCWNTTGSPTLSDSYANHSYGGTGSYNLTMSGLLAGTTYYVRAFATNSVGTSYGNEETFTTPAAAPTVTIDSLTNMTGSTVVYHSNVTHDGGDPVTSRGMVWFDQNTYYNYWTWPDIYNYTGITSDGAGIGTFSDTIKNLDPGQCYYLLSYATNSIGTSYGGYQNFCMPTTVPYVTNNQNATNIGAENANLDIQLVNNGGESYAQEIGVCWDTNATPTITSSAYSSCSDWYDWYGMPYQCYGYISGLNANTTYWARAYATNGNGTSYGTAISFTTLKLPTVTTDTVTNITQTSANSGVNVLDDGGNAVSACGVCWDTLPNPTVSNGHSTDGAGMGQFSFASLASDLNDSTVYYLRAYATSSAGTGYGQQISFTTLGFKSCPGVPTVTDYDGNVYKTIQIGNQCWMRENLRTEHYSDGTQITAGVITSTFIPLRYKPGYSWDNVPAEYGYLYNWAAVMNGASSSNSVPSNVQGVCPTGWHVPSYNEWLIFINYVNGKPAYLCNGSYNARGLVSQLGQWGNCGNGCYVHGSNPSSSRNMTGFSILPAGYYYQNGDYSEGYNSYARLWSTTETGTNVYAPSISDCSQNIDVSWSQYDKYYGHSVRCIQDYTIADGGPCPGTPTVNDNDGNTYNTVEIGSQCWMKENLRTTKYPDGTSISYGEGMSTSTSTGYYYYVNGNSSNTSTYGLLYNWPAAMNGSNTEGAQGICPTGWHIPTQSDWSSLINYTEYVYQCNGTTGYYANALASNSNWTSYSTNCTVGYDLTSNNSTGFSAEPAGYRTTGVTGFSNYAYFWCSYMDPYNSDYAYAIRFRNRWTNVSYFNSDYSGYGESVRCIKD